MVTRPVFERILGECNVQLTKHEFQTLTKVFKETSQQGNSVINYIRMSEELGLHSKKLTMI